MPQGPRFAVRLDLAAWISLVALFSVVCGQEPPSAAAAASSVQRSECAEKWSIDGLRLGMSLVEFKKVHPNAEYLGMNGTDPHRSSEPANGQWYRWPTDRGDWNRVRFQGHGRSSPIVAFSLVKDYDGWDSRQLNRILDGMAGRWGEPEARHVPLRTTRYAGLFGAPKKIRKWGTTIWVDQSCDVMATVMYRMSRDYRNERVTELHLALTKASPAPLRPESEGKPEAAACGKWSFGELRPGMTLGEFQERIDDEERLGLTAGGGWTRALRHERAPRQLCLDGVDDDSDVVAVRRSEYDDAGWTALLRVEGLIELWGPPTDYDVPVETTAYFRAFGGFYPFSTGGKEWRATVWEDERCDVMATVVYAEVKERDYAFGIPWMPVSRTTCVGIVLHERGRTKESGAALCRGDRARGPSSRRRP